MTGPLGAASWGLWLQLPLVIAVLAMTWPQIRDSLSASAIDRQALAGAGALVLAAAFWIPIVPDPWIGHEAIYLALLQGMPPDPAELGATYTMPFAAGVAWWMGVLLPSGPAELLWLAGSRLSFGLVGLLLGAAAAQLVGASARRHALWLGLLGTALAVPLAAWSATGFGLAPAMVLGSLALLLAVRGHGAAAVVWTTLALATRLEWTGLLPAVVLLPGLAALRKDRGTWVVAALALGLEVLLIQGKTGGMPGVPDRHVARDNLANLPLGGPWFSWVTLACVVALVLITAAPGLKGWTRLVWIACIGAAAAQVITILDFGARHLLPAHALVITATAAALAGARSAIGRRVGLGAVVGALAVSLAIVGGRGYLELRHRVTGPDPGVLRSHLLQVSPEAQPLDAALDPGCTHLLPGGPDARPGAWNALDPGIVRDSIETVQEGGCIQWALRPGIGFAGDAQIEFADRAVRSLDLRPERWVVAPDGARWFLLRSPPSGPSQRSR
mgnify:CR=1 FL=1